LGEAAVAAGSGAGAAAAAASSGGARSSLSGPRKSLVASQMEAEEVKAHNEYIHIKRLLEREKLHSLVCVVLPNHLILEASSSVRPVPRCVPYST
jgi:hypothetical protein